MALLSYFNFPSLIFPTLSFSLSLSPLLTLLLTLTLLITAFHITRYTLLAPAQHKIKQASKKKHNNIQANIITTHAIEPVTKPNKTHITQLHKIFGYLEKHVFYEVNKSLVMRTIEHGKIKPICCRGANATIKV